MRAVVHDVLVAAVVGLGVHRVGALQPERVARVDLVRRVVAARAGVVVERVAVVVVGRSGKGRWRPVRRRGGRRHRARTACRTKRRSPCLERRTRGRRRRLRGRAAGGQRQRGGEAASADRHRPRLRRNLRTRLSGFSRAVGVVVCVGCGGGAPPPPRSLSRSLVCLSDAVGGCNEGAPQTPRRRRLFGRTFTRDAGSWRCWGPPSLYAACAVEGSRVHYDAGGDGLCFYYGDANFLLEPMLALNGRGT